MIDKVEEKKIWLTSDLHFCHNKEFLYSPRGFDNIYDMNETIVKNWNSVVSVNDDVYILGDLMLVNNEEGIKLLKNLKGNIHIILGNHDTGTRVELYNNCYNVVEICYATIIKYNGYHFYLSHYPTITGNGDKDLKHTLINLYGHTHQKTNFFNDVFFMYHVGVDSHNCFPVLIDDIIQELIKKCE